MAPLWGDLGDISGDVWECAFTPAIVRNIEYNKVLCANLLNHILIYLMCAE